MINHVKAEIVLFPMTTNNQFSKITEVQLILLDGSHIIIIQRCSTDWDTTGDHVTHRRAAGVHLTLA